MAGQRTLSRVGARWIDVQPEGSGIAGTAHGPTDSAAGDLRNEPKEEKRPFIQLLSSLLLDLAHMRELRAWLNELIDARALKLAKRYARWSPLAHTKRGAPKGALYPTGRADGS